MGNVYEQSGGLTGSNDSLESPDREEIAAKPCRGSTLGLFPRRFLEEPKMGLYFSLVWGLVLALTIARTFTQRITKSG